MSIIIFRKMTAFDFQFHKTAILNVKVLPYIFSPASESMSSLRISHCQSLLLSWRHAAKHVAKTMSIGRMCLQVKLFLSDAWGQSSSKVDCIAQISSTMTRSHKLSLVRMTIPVTRVQSNRKDVRRGHHKRAIRPSLIAAGARGSCPSSRLPRG